MDKPVSSDMIYKDLLNRIISLELIPGEKISENKISEEYDVSRSVVRNAFARLAQDDFLTILPQRGSYVSLIDLNYIKTALVIRVAIEKEMLYRFMIREDNSDIIDKMEENVRQQEKFYRAEDYLMEFKELDEQFHEYIILSVDREGKILELLSEHLLHISRWRNVYIKSGYKVGDLVNEHKKILKAIKDKKLGEAMNCMTEHIHTVSDVLGLDSKFVSYFK